MSTFKQNRTFVLSILTCCALFTATVQAQEATKPADDGKTVEETAKQAAPPTPALPSTMPPSEDPKISEDGTVPEFSIWTHSVVPVGLKTGNGEYRIPAITNACASIEETKLQLDGAMEEAMTSFLFSRLNNYDLARRLTPPAATIRNRYLVTDVPEIEKKVVEGVTSYRAALQLKIKDQELAQWTRQDLHKRQGIAVFRTLFLGGGVLAFVTILAIQARLNFATNGKRSGILRAATMIAILSLLGGLTTAAILGRVFTS